MDSNKTDELLELIRENNALLHEHNRILSKLERELVGPDADLKEFGLNVAADIFANNLHFGPPGQLPWNNPLLSQK